MRDGDGAPALLRAVRPSGIAAQPLAWLQAAQVAVGAAVRGEAPVRLALAVEQLDRADAFSVVAETLDLVQGLVATGRLRAVTLAELAELTE